MFCCFGNNGIYITARCWRLRAEIAAMERKLQSLSRQREDLRMQLEASVPEEGAE